MCIRLCVRMLICLWISLRRREKALSQSDFGFWDWPCISSCYIAADDNAGLVQAIETKNITYLTKFPKIGKKTAQQMVLDLEGKVVVAGDDLPAKVAVQASAENKELEGAMEAMLALGYKATELKKIKKFFEGTTDTAENYIKSALKMLVK